MRGTSIAVGRSSDEDIWYTVGQGNWRAFRAAGLDVERVERAAKRWAEALKGIRRPWLCWNVASDWCLVQQRLVKMVGWTPVIGYDPRVGPPANTVEGAITIDFNAELKLPILYPHFPLEFVFLVCDKLAFWHSDLLIRKELMAELAKKFDAIKDGETIVTKPLPHWGAFVSVYNRRYWELVGCTTRAASRRQFEAGCGWWMSFSEHINCHDDAKRKKRSKYYWDHGSGIYYWHKYCSGNVIALNDKRIHEGHFTKIGNPNYKRAIPANMPEEKRQMSKELIDNFDLLTACSKLALSDFVR
jgi:hypothetical protein